MTTKRLDTPGSTPDPESVTPGDEHDVVIVDARLSAFCPDVAATDEGLSFAASWLGSASSWFSDLLSLFDFDSPPPPPTSNGEPPPVSNVGVVIDPDGRIPPPPG